MDTSIKRYPAKEHHQPVERICRTLELRDDPQLIAEYRRRHSQGAIWPEIPAGIREAGILEMEIYLLDTRLFMIVEVPVGFDWDAAMKRPRFLAPTTGVGRLYGHLPACETRFHSRREVATDGAYFPPL